jgi:RimJ/RimL family protein N-acetyltransferase
MQSPYTDPCPPRLEPITVPCGRREPHPAHHADDLHQAAQSHPAIWDHMPTLVDGVSDLERLIAGAHEMASAGLSLPFAVVAQDSGRAVGSTRYLDYRPADRGVEIGWTWYSQAHQGTAVNPESKLLLLRHAFDTLGCMRVQFKTDSRNLRSRAAIAKLGAKEEGTLRKHMLVRGSTIRDSVYFSILDDEWPAVQTSLAARIAALTG